MDLVYRDLCAIADRQLRNRYGRDLAGATLEPSALVNEAFLRLIRQRNRYDTRGHFFAIATKTMIRVLADHVRSKQAAKRGGQDVRVTLTGLADSAASHDMADFLRALERLETADPRTCEVAKLRLLWGLTLPEIVEALGTSQSTVERDWRFARSWLIAELG